MSNTGATTAATRSDQAKNARRWGGFAAVLVFVLIAFVAGGGASSTGPTPIGAPEEPQEPNVLLLVIGAAMAAGLFWIRGAFRRPR